MSKQKISKQDLLQFIENFQSVPTLVLGDLMLDHYLFGSVSRISPEAPVPIVQAQYEKFLLGGAGSCVANLNALQNSVEIAALCGKDKYGEILQRILQEAGNSTKFLLIPKDYKTTIKTRILSKKQHLLRIDHEQEIKISVEKFEPLREKLADLSQFQAMILSDYGKGFFTPCYTLPTILQIAKSQNLFTIVDPARGVNFRDYTGASCIKPNRLEAEIFTEIKLKEKKDYLQAAKKICKICSIPIVALSLDSEGLLIYQKQRHGKEAEAHFFQTTPQSVFDVTGAGDLVVSMLCLVLASGGKIEIAGNLANIAASIAIRNLGSYHPSWQEIKEEIKKSF